MFEEDRLFWSSSRSYLASDNLEKVGNCAVVQREKGSKQSWADVRKMSFTWATQVKLWEKNSSFDQIEKTSSEEKYSAE